MTHFERVVTREKPTSLKLLAEGQVGARIAAFRDGTEAIMKVGASQATKKRSKTQRGIDIATMPAREVAFYTLAKIFGYEDVVPETVLGKFEGFPASFQRYVDNAKLYEVEPALREMRKDRTAWIIALRETLRDKLDLEDARKLTLLDFLAASRDRHAANYGARLSIAGGKASWRLVGWDNGCAFGLTQERYHCVAHKHLFRHAFDLQPLWQNLLSKRREDFNILSDKGYISVVEVDHIWYRLQFVLAFPHRMPWVVLSKNTDDINGFPHLSEIFVPMVASRSLYVLQRNPD